MSKLLFTYNSLKKGEEGHSQLKGANYLGKAKTTNKYKLVKGDNLVGLTDGDEVVHGELYAVDDEILRRVDKYEWKCYVRKQIKLSIGKKAFAYFLKN